ncbi:hypothetical protein [Acididesulfobacillus acetoxydans]|uniref:hypothetical protein n=1 Tax=Acididesulfobacillus acetoxydans TaxID=1561005 RepID=UPI001F0DDB05|nr:hypothetical protein [Acididesulfobacillus acetoxydans]
MADRERRERDLDERFRVEVEIRLEHVVAYHVPCLRVRLELQHKDKVLPYTVLFNPVMGELEPPVCECCGRHVTHLIPSKESFVCENCSAPLDIDHSRGPV